MVLDLLSGLLLTVVVIGAIAYVVREMLSDRAPDLGKAKQGLADAVSKYAGGDAKPVNEHLIGSTGQVVALTGDADRPMSVRLGLELWPARLREAGASPLPVGASVRVASVEGPMVVVDADGGANADAEAGVDADAEAGAGARTAGADSGAD